MKKKGKLARKISHTATSKKMLVINNKGNMNSGLYRKLTHCAFKSYKQSFQEATTSTIPTSEIQKQEPNERPTEVPTTDKFSQGTEQTSVSFCPLFTASLHRRSQLSCSSQCPY